MDDFRFEDDLNRFFGSVVGVGSKITEKDEANKRQLTVAKHERELLLKFHKNIPVGSLKAAEQRGEQTLFGFKKFPTGQVINLKVNFPKPGKNELRLYFNEEAFSPTAGDNWFFFEKEGEIWIGSLDDSELSAAKQGAVIDLQNGFDHVSEDAYQDAANRQMPELVSSFALRYRRDPKVATKALVGSGYSCEMMPEHRIFVSKVTKKPYLEAHHFVPMMEQRHFDSSLDVLDNICILNPFAHKMLHHATYEEIEPYLRELAKPRMDFLKTIGVSVDRVLRSYGRP